MSDFRFPGWPNGLNNVGREDQMPASALRKGLNVDLLAGGKPRRRKGYQRVYAGVSMESGFAHRSYLLALENRILKRWVDFDTTPLTIAEALQPPVGYVEINDEVIWADKAHRGKVDAFGQPALFSLAAPAGQPTLSALNYGGLDEGLYQVAITYSAQGLESGTGQAVYKQVPEGGGIQLTNMPVPGDDVELINIYMSQANGETLYFRTSIPAGTTQYDLGYLRTRRALRTQFMDSLPASPLMAFYNGVLFTAVDSVLYYSRALNYGLYHCTEDYILQDSEINLLLAGDSGIFVGNETGVRFFSGNSPDRFSSTTVSGPAIPGASLSVDGGYVIPELQGQTVAIWWTTEGVMMVGTPNGRVEPVRDTEFRVPSAERGMMSPVTREGVKQLVSVMKNPGTKSSFAFGDEMEIEVHRHGVTT